MSFAGFHYEQPHFSMSNSIPISWLFILIIIISYSSSYCIISRSSLLLCLMKYQSSYIYIYIYKEIKKFPQLTIKSFKKVDHQVFTQILRYELDATHDQFFKLCTTSFPYSKRVA